MLKRVALFALTGLLVLPSLAYAQDSGEQDPPAAVFQYLFAALAVLIILVIACVPSRRAYPQQKED